MLYLPQMIYKRHYSTGRPLHNDQQQYAIVSGVPLHQSTTFVSEVFSKFNFKTYRALSHSTRAYTYLDWKQKVHFAYKHYLHHVE